MKINPNFEFDKYGIEPETQITPGEILEHVNGLIQHTEKLSNESCDNKPHEAILKKLIEQVEPVDFEALANPNNIENFKLNGRHYAILCIENILDIANKNSWGLCKNQDFIYLFNGAYWSEIDKEVFQKFLGEAAEKMGVPVFSARYYQFREQLFKQFLATAYLPTPESSKDKVMINLQNGTFEISQQGTKLRPFNREDFITYQLPFKYDPEAKAPLFEAYLNRVLPDPERQRVLAEYLGYLFVKHGNLKLEAALILYGTGENGKSVFFEIVNALFGRENVSNYSLQELTDNSGYYRAMIANKLVNYASEINGKLEIDTFKRMVSGEAITARLPYGKPMNLTQYAKFIFNCNELPKEVEYSNAYFRRWLIIPFDVTIPKDEQDKDLHTKIIDSELSGVFNWVLQGLYRILEQRKFSPCDAARKAIEQYKIESDSVQMFLHDNEYSASLNKEIKLKDMFNEYRVYCYDSGFKSCSLKTFTDRLRNSGYLTQRKNFGTVVFAEKKVFF